MGCRRGTHGVTPSECPGYDDKLHPHRVESLPLYGANDPFCVKAP